MPLAAHHVFDFHAAVAALKHLVKGSAAPSTKSRLCTLLYFAEKVHLERYGLYFMGDEFHAHEFGPAPAQTLAGLQVAHESSRPNLSTVVQDFFRAHVRVENGCIAVGEEINTDYYLSESATECLTIALTSLGGLASDHLCNYSRQEDAWKVAWSSGNRVMSQELIAQSLPNAEIVLRYIKSMG